MASVLKQFLTEYVASRTKTFGGGKSSAWGNPIADALKDEPPCFATGVRVEKVVDLVLEGIKEARNQSVQLDHELSLLEDQQLS